MLKRQGNGERDIQSTLVKEGSEFFEQLLELYFAIFGRGNTLNERLLDVEDPAFKWRGCAVMGLVFSRVGDGRRSPALSVSRTDDVGILRVSHAVWNSLLSDWKLGEQFWTTAWDTYQEIARKPPDAAGDVEVHRDWVQTAASRMNHTSEAGEKSLNQRLQLARQEAEDAVLRERGPLVEDLKGLFPEKTLSTSQRLEKLLRMIQGSLCLVPWARHSGTPLPVFTIPATKGSGTDTVNYRCAWTVIPADVDADPASWRMTQRHINDLFFEAAKVHAKLVAKDTVTAALPWEGAPELDREVRDRLRELLTPLGKRFGDVVEVAMELTGDRHEGRETSYCLLFGAPETLKYVDRIISNELSNSPDIESARSREDLRLRCQGHYSLFQEPGVAGFLDQYQSSLSIQKVVWLKSPSEEEFADMRAASILDDSFRDLRWLTWKMQDENRGRVAAVVAGGDGILRIFVSGKLILAWRKRAGPGDNRWQMGIEFSSKDVKELKELVASELGLDPTAASVQDIVSAISLISNTLGEGAVFVMGGDHDPWAIPELSDMVPDDFKMQWARDRRLSGVEQRMLHSLAIMDGAIHIGAVHSAIGDSVADSDVWIGARRYIAPPTSRGQGRVPTGTHIVRLFRKWIREYESATSRHSELKEHKEHQRHGRAYEELKKWQYKIGTKGTRHRSVFQLCFSYLRKRNPPLVCSISADGPVHLYQAKKCVCGKTYLWTETIIS